MNPSWNMVTVWYTTMSGLFISLLIYCVLLKLTYHTVKKSNPNTVYDVTDFFYKDTFSLNKYMHTIFSLAISIEDVYEGCSKWIAYFYLETSNFKWVKKCSFHANQVLPVARNAKLQPMYPLPEGVTVHWFGHSKKVLMNGRSKSLPGLVFPPSKEFFQFRKHKEITWGKM